MRRVAAGIAVALALGTVGPVWAQSKDAKPMPEASRTADKATIGTRSVTGTVKSKSDHGLVVLGRESGQTDKEWAFALDPATKIDAAGKARQLAEMKEGEQVTVTYTNRDGKIVAQTVTVDAP